MAKYYRHDIELFGDPEDISIVRIMLAMPEKPRSIDFDQVAAARKIHALKLEAESELGKDTFCLFNIESPRAEDLTRYVLSEAGLSTDDFSAYWQNETWGVTNSEYESYLVEQSLGRLTYFVQSALGTPDLAIYTLSSLFPRVRIKVEWWSENDTWGQYVLIAGQVIFEERINWPTQPFVDKEPRRDGALEM